MTEPSPPHPASESDPLTRGGEGSGLSDVIEQALAKALLDADQSDPPMLCPTCTERPNSYGLSNKIGGRRNGCRTCNSFAQRVLRLSAKRLANLHPKDYEKIKAQAAKDVYAALRKPVVNFKGLR